ncbi:MAG: DUF2812 domain-containing protein [Turicibacter sp.]|nr:DUF2812 domain-containing protein [Turicibacter sp.]
MKTEKKLPLGDWIHNDEKELEKFADWAREGWILQATGMPYHPYKLVKGEPQNLVYAVDYFTDKRENYAEYLRLFEAGGWKLVVRTEAPWELFNKSLCIFSAIDGTPPIYTDKTTKAEIYGFRKKKSLKFFYYYTVLAILSSTVELTQLMRGDFGIRNILWVLAWWIPVAYNTYKFFYLRHQERKFCLN